MKALVFALGVALPGLAQGHGAAPTDTLDRSIPVPPGPARPYQAPSARHAMLNNGVQLAVAELRRLPLVSVRMLLPFAGSAYDPDGKAGLAELVASLMTEGTKTLSSRRLGEALDDLGAEVKVEVGHDALVFSVFIVKENLEKALGLVAAMLRSPALPKTEFARLQQESLIEAQAAKGNPAKLAEDRLKARIAGRHPYGRAETAASLSAITVVDAWAFHASHVRPEGAVLAAAGDVDLPEFERLAAEHFGKWKAQGGRELPPDIPELPEPDTGAQAQGMVIDVIDRSGADQSDIRVGHRTLSRSAPDFYPVIVLDFLLASAGVNARLDRNLREQHGWSYGADSKMSALRKGGLFVAGAAVQADATAKALLEILKEFSILRETPMPEEELAVFKGMLAGRFIREMQTVQSISAQFGLSELYGLPRDSLTQHRDRILAVTPAQLQAAAQAHLRAGDLQVVIAGDAARIRTELSAIAPVRVFDADGNPKDAKPRS